MNNRVYLMRGWNNGTICCTSIWSKIEDALTTAAAVLREDPIDYFEIQQYEQIAEEDYQIQYCWEIKCTSNRLPF